MPTVGWIQETAIDRYWERGGDGVAYTITPTTYSCPFCATIFETAVARATHISVHHPLERPVLFIRSRAVESEFAVRTSLRVQDVSCANCQAVNLVLDGQSVPGLEPKLFTQQLTSRKQGFYEVTLENRRTIDGARSRAKYLIRVAIPKESSLSSIDGAFVRHLAIDHLGMTSVRRFGEACARITDAVDYLDALANYAIGVLIKDQDTASGATLPFAAFLDKFQAAIVILSDYPRPVAQTVAACIRFNLNDFSKFYSPTGVELLDEAMAVLRHLAGASMAPPRTDKKTHGKIILPACPIDRRTNELLALFAESRSAPRLSVETVHKFESVIEAGTTSDLDRVKHQAILADAALRCGDVDSARLPLRALANDHSFGPWASSQLRVIGDL
jgi:hypothetical protein